MTNSALARPALLFCALAASVGPAHAADAPLGRLFFTPAQRASLDVARTQRARAVLSNEKTDETPAAPVPQTLTYDGAVRRSDGRATIFVNGHPLTEKDSAAGTVIGRVRPDGGVSLQIPQSGRSVDLKPGQSVELLSGVIEERYSRKPAELEAKPAAKPEAAAKESKPAAGGRAGAERDREDQQRKLEEAVRMLQEAAAAKSGAMTEAPQENPAPAPSSTTN